MLFQIKSFLNFIKNSSNQHGVHSPFVYDLTTQCFYTKDHINNYNRIDKYRKKLLGNTNKIKITDFGAGSKKLQYNERKISEIAHKAGISKKRGQLLYRIVTYFNIHNILEIGTSLGIATASMSLANENATITTLEGCSGTAEIAQEQFDTFQLNNISLIVGEFGETLPKELKNKTFDLIYFDGNHQKEPTIHYFEQCLNHIHNESIFIFDDIYWSKEMNEAWNYIREHQRVTVSIDTFKWGIVFFRKEQVKEHFTIRL